MARRGDGEPAEVPAEKEGREAREKELARREVLTTAQAELAKTTQPPLVQAG